MADWLYGLFVYVGLPFVYFLKFVSFGYIDLFDPYGLLSAITGVVVSVVGLICLVIYLLQHLHVVWVA